MECGVVLKHRLAGHIYASKYSRRGRAIFLLDTPLVLQVVSVHSTPLRPTGSEGMQ